MQKAGFLMTRLIYPYGLVESRYFRLTAISRSVASLDSKGMDFGITQLDK